MFNDVYGLTQATIEGRKTMTRRLIPQEFFTLTWDVREDTLVFENEWGDFIDIRRSKYAQYKVGEVVAVAQSYERIHDEICKNSRYDGLYQVLSTTPGWRNKMFVKAELMPYRIRITGIKVEHLQDISNVECLKEGVTVTNAVVNGECVGEFYGYEPGRVGVFNTPIGAFSALIDKVSGRGTWAGNPWAFAYQYELLK